MRKLRIVTINIHKGFSWGNRRFILHRLREAIRQVRAAAGPNAALRVLEVDPDSRFPERRAVLTPFEG